MSQSDLTTNRPPTGGPSNSPSRKILVGLTGSIACYKTATVLSTLKKAGHEVRVVATPSALKFIGDATLEGLTGEPVHSDTFTSGQMMDHIHLARWADIFLVAPMTANHINKFALGLADDLLTTLYIAYEKNKPLYLAPAMNSVMYAHETVQIGINTLQARGAKIIEPGEGLLACGETGAGRMAEPEEILEAIFPGSTAALGATPAALRVKPRVLITFGGTKEIIDGVRAITNTSTGATGATLADEFLRLGFQVTALAAKTAVRPSQVQDLHTFETHRDLNDKAAELLARNSYAAVIHLAAVSDFGVDKIVVNGENFAPSPDLKLSSEQPLTLKLKLNGKIVNQLREYSKNKNIFVIAFKLTNTHDLKERASAVKKLLVSRDVDMVVHNDFHDIDKTQNRHSFEVHSNTGATLKANHAQALAAELTQLIRSRGES